MDVASASPKDPESNWFRIDKQKDDFRCKQTLRSAVWKASPYNRLVAANGKQEWDNEKGEKLVESYCASHPRVFDCAVLRALGREMFLGCWVFDQEDEDEV